MTRLRRAWSFFVLPFESLARGQFNVYLAWLAFRQGFAYLVFNRPANLGGGSR